MPWGEVVGEASFGTLGAISTTYGEKGPSQGQISSRGVAGLGEAFPLLDYVTSCAVVDDETTADDWAPYPADFRHATFRARGEA